MRNLLLLFGVGLFLLSCKDIKTNEISSLVKQWERRKIEFPSHSVFTVLGEDTVDYKIQHGYKILIYADSVGCTSCKLRLIEWKNFMSMVNFGKTHTVQLLLFLYPKNEKDRMEICHALRMNQFYYPVCIDTEDRLNKLNVFPSDITFQTFLLEKNNQVVAIGNPVHNPKVKELYLRILRGEQMTTEEEDKKIITEVEVDKTTVSFSKFPWQEEQYATFSLKNTGDKLLVVQNVTTSAVVLPYLIPKNRYHQVKKLSWK